MDEQLVSEESNPLFQSAESAKFEDDFCKVDLPYECDISYSLGGTDIPLVSKIPFQSEYCSDEELKPKVLTEFLKHLKKCGVIRFVTVLIKEGNRRIDIV